MDEETRVCRQCGTEWPIEDYQFSGGARRRVCRYCRTECARKSYYRVRGLQATERPPIQDSWPPMPEILKNQYWSAQKGREAQLHQAMDGQQERQMIGA